jgi:hypothetical protein
MSCSQTSAGNFKYPHKSLRERITESKINLKNNNPEHVFKWEGSDSNEEVNGWSGFRLIGLQKEDELQRFYSSRQVS